MTRPDTRFYASDRAETTLWATTLVSALFEEGVDLEGISAELANRLPNSLADTPAMRVTWDTLDESDWVDRFESELKPMCFGSRLWVCPIRYRDGAVPEDAIAVRLDPGLAFGSGSHPTTGLCLGWLDRYVQPQTTILDYGCGSGILAIAAARLGARTAFAVDTDPQALEAARANAARNDVSDRVAVHHPGDLPALEADLVVANILVDTLMELAPSIAGMTIPGGRLALSGLLENEVEAVSGAYREWFRIEAPSRRDEWLFLSGLRHAG